jgi:hypothetical protein
MRPPSPRWRRALESDSLDDHDGALQWADRAVAILVTADTSHPLNIIVVIRGVILSPTAFKQERGRWMRPPSP